MSATRLLYLGISFPPGVQALYPAISPAGHGFETQLVAALRDHFEIRSATTLPVRIPASAPEAEPTSGVRHDLILLEQAPEFVHRFQSLTRLKAQYRRWQASGWQAEVVLVYNLSPIYNHFVRWLRRQSPRPRLVLLLLDSSQLGRPLPRLKRWRYRLKPFVVPDADMIRAFDACIGLSRTVERFFAERPTPFLWMPGACTPGRAAPSRDGATEDRAPIAFGYFGALAPHAGVMPLVRTFLSSPRVNPLHVCGYGRLGEELAELARGDARLRFHGLLPTPEDCLRLARSWDLLVNPRPATHGNENSFPSKIFEYALCGRAILTSRMAGVDEVLGDAAFYFDPANFESDLRAVLASVAERTRSELRRRGAVLQQRILRDYTWDRQAARVAQFIQGLPRGLAADPG
jgi:glycosyltransferase involved in cell wall biosynthesis